MKFFILQEQGKLFCNFCSFHFTACGRKFSDTTGEIDITTNAYNGGTCTWEIHSSLLDSSILLVVEILQKDCW